MNIPKWAIEEYPGCEEDFAKWLETQFLESHYKEEMSKAFDIATGEILDKELYERTKALAKFETLQRTTQFRSVVERSQAWQLYQANKSGWFRLLPPEFDTIEELLASMVDGIDEGTSEFYDMAFLVKQAIPLMQKAGASIEDIFGLKLNISKSRAAVPYMREIISENISRDFDCLSDEEKSSQETKTIEKLMEVANEIISDVPVREFKRKMQVLRGKNQEIPEQVIARKYILRDHDIYIVPSNCAAQNRSIELSLRCIVEEFVQCTVTDLLKDIQDIITGNL